MSNSSEPKDLTYPEKPDSNGYAKKYFKRRAYYFGAHNSPESFMLFGEWKRRLVETGSAPEVKKLRKELAQQAIPSPHLHLGAPVRKEIPYNWQRSPAKPSSCSSPPSWSAQRFSHPPRVQQSMESH